jgi:chromosome segregation ATPase
VTDDLDARLDAATAKVSEIEARKQRLVGQLEAARKSLAEVEEECRSKGVEPEELDDTIKKVRGRYEALVEKLERDVADADAALAPYEEP